MDVAEALEMVREIDKLTKENPAILMLIENMKDTEPKPIVTDCFVSMGKAAEILGTNVNYVCDMVKKGLLPCWVLPGKTQRKFKLSDIYSFMNEKCRRG